MSQSLLTALVAVAVVAILGLLMRRMAGSPQPGTGLPPPEATPADDDPGDADDLIESLEAFPVAMTSDGWSFMPLADRERVRLVPPPVPEGTGPGAPRPGPEQMARGDLVGARVRRGAPDHDPWRLEAIGRDGEYRAWRFETEDAARAALALVSRSIVLAPRDEDDREVTPGDADYEEARRRDEEIESELASMPDVEERPEGRLH